jgi:hypothetical protein
LNELNLKLQAANSLISDLYTYIKAFELKLTLFTKQLKENNLAHFPTCNKFKFENDKEFPTDFAVGVLIYLKEQFQTHFRDFKSTENHIRTFENLFAVEIKTLPTDLQLEVIDLISNNNFKDYFKENSLQKFYTMLPEESFLNVKNRAREITSIFSSTYLCKQTFLKMKYLKSKYRTNLSDEHIQATLLIGITKFDANYEEILKSKQFQISH